jgi:hypothetical protein
MGEMGETGGWTRDEMGEAGGTVALRKEINFFEPFRPSLYFFYVIYFAYILCLIPCTAD